MRINWDYIKLTFLSVAVVALYGFAGHRNQQKKVENVTVKFVGESNLYLTEDAVNKLLIQNYGPLKNTPKEQLVLNTIEEILLSNDMVKNAQVYLTVNGELVSKIVQRKPIGRIEGVSKFYLDDQGKRMPLSKYHSARVPIITGKITGKTLEDAYVILDYINQDDFLRKNVIGIHIEEEGNYQLRFRMENFVVNLGGVDNLNKKFKNFMAFYAKAAKDNSLEDYATVSLEFNNQVVCTKI
ncbi:cell division protein FtsQ/DivIB [Allomuricauda sp.]|uniref:cell division protein FtsQ/DivIB n=1 Tax=Flagellimonas alginolytica TaxID=3177515 RepID=UPI0025D06499|nr:cell division protein FtsQ/DivIB [Allomuricauda sp.]